ncbi:hypothetical protein BJF84_14630 [Rhodococcus sp. CUA-806]|nr:hypothetical protein BJF84_14630 [Rhodococcus sp. CUA-806]
MGDLGFVGGGTGRWQVTKGSMVTQRDDFEEYITRRNPFKRLELVDLGDLTDDERRSLPPAWLDIAELDGTRAIDRALKMWEDALPGRFPGTVANLRDRGLGVFLARVLPHQDDPTCVVLVYAIRRNASPLPFDACFGYLPAGTSQFPEFWPRLSEDFRRFHTHVHDGFRANLAEFCCQIASGRFQRTSYRQRCPSSITSMNISKRCLKIGVRLSTTWWSLFARARAASLWMSARLT